MKRLQLYVSSKLNYKKGTIIGARKKQDGTLGHQATTRLQNLRWMGIIFGTLIMVGLFLLLYTGSESSSATSISLLETNSNNKIDNTVEDHHDDGIPEEDNGNDNDDGTPKSNTNTDPTDYCQHYDGVLWISQGDRNGAFGTIFYLFIMNQLLYAERHNLQPFIHLTDVSRHIYDPQVHGTDEITQYPMGPEMEVTWEKYPDPLASDKVFRYPGRPKLREGTKDSDETVLEVKGTGVWNSYFKSVVSLTLGPRHRQATFDVDLTRPCPNKPWVHLQTDEQLVQGLHLNCPYCVRAWKYGGVPPSLRQQQDDGTSSALSSSYQDWWNPMRHHAAWMVSKYYHSQSHLREAARKATQTTATDNHEAKCLAVHIRHSDKANKREKIALAAFLPYCQAYIDAGGKLIYLATDSSRVIDKIKEEWPAEIFKAITFQSGILRSPDDTAVFDPAILSQVDQQQKMDQHHHRTNSEVMVDILAMSRCQWLLHGLSAVSEATIYTNLKLKDSSVNLEFYRYYKNHPPKAGAVSDAPLSVDEFQQRLQRG